MSESKNCMQAYEQLYPYLDRELSDDEKTIVRQHLEACPPCAHLFQFEGTIVHYVHKAAGKDCCPAETATSIITGFRARIRAQL
jgi:mycothiol system anti-sigma-R factor